MHAAQITYNDMHAAQIIYDDMHAAQYNKFDTL